MPRGSRNRLSTLPSPRTTRIKREQDHAEEGGVHRFFSGKAPTHEQGQSPLVGSESDLQDFAPTLTVLKKESGDMPECLKGGGPFEPGDDQANLKDLSGKRGACFAVAAHRLLSNDEGDEPENKNRGSLEAVKALAIDAQSEGALPSPCVAASSEDLSSHTRLIISHIDVENFKSYFGQHRIGPFHKTFSAVIGPNGSGKSNVIDSMLFVFGRNARKIRLAKLTEVIHNSATHQDVSFASVTVCFVRVKESPAESTDPDQRQEVPNSELRIKREVFRSGISQYYINGIRRSQKDVIVCLTQHGIDLEHNRFLILQGEVEQIALMKPRADKEGEEGLLEYLDDLIGTSDYIGRISDATRAAEAAQLERLDALDRERKLKAEREALDKAKDSTVAFVIKDNQLQKTLIVMCQLRMRGIEERLAEPRRLLEEIDARIGALKENVEVCRVVKAEIEEDIARRKKGTAEAVKERDMVRAKKQNAESQLEKLKSSAQDQERSHLKVIEHIKKFRDDGQKAQMLQQDAEREAAIHQQGYEQATRDVSTLQAAHDDLSLKLLPQLRPLRQELDEKKKLLAPYDRAVMEVAEQLSSAQQRLTALHELSHKKLELLEQAERLAAQHGARIEELSRTLREVEGSDHKDELLRMQDMLTEATQRKYAINSTISELKNVYREGEADDRAMEFLLSQRSLKGYYGTLRQLGRIDDAYDIAAGVASNAWGFHVVEDRATATAALNALKRNSMGRATMMVISEVEREAGGRMARPFISPNPKAKRLFDLIKPTNDKFRSVFYQAVRDTLVVSTLAEARETAFQGNQRLGGDKSQPLRRFRVVTLKGELVEPSGVITGGGDTPRGAKLKAARSPQDKLAVKEELQRLQQELVQAAEEERASQLRLHQLRESQGRLSPEQVRRLKGEHRTLSVTMDHELVCIQALRQECDHARQNEAEKQLPLQDAVDECQKRLLQSKQAREGHQHDIEKLEARIDKVGGDALQELTGTLKKARDQQEAEEKALRECRRRIQKLRAKQERMQRDIAEHESRLKELEAEDKGNLKEKVAECAAQVEELSGQLHAADEALTKLQAVSNSIKATLPEASSALAAAQARLEDENRYRRTQSAKMADALQELAKFAQKIEGCEEKIKENAELYGIETLQLEPAEEETRIDDDEDEEASAEPGAASSTKEQVRKMSFRLHPEELNRCDYERSVHLAKTLSEETKRLHSEIDFRAVALWRERDVAHREALTVYEAKKHTSDELEEALSELKYVRRKAFFEVFEDIRRKLKEVYQYLTRGGDADMELVDVNDPFEGVLFVVRPPKKSWKQISNLSGGEKTLSSLALIFALHHIKPTPIYVMDEIDAALDFRNVFIVANYVLSHATDAQFIIISLRNNMFEMAHQLVGVCKVNDVTATLSFMPSRFERVVHSVLLAKQQQRLQQTLQGRRPKSTQKTSLSEEGTPFRTNAVRAEVNGVDRNASGEGGVTVAHPRDERNTNFQAAKERGEIGNLRCQENINVSMNILGRIPLRDGVPDAMQQRIL